MRPPVLMVEGSSIAEAWESGLVRLWKEGIPVPTEYDDKASAPSRDATMVMVVKDPQSEPRIHLAFPGGLEDLEKYRQEVVLGVHDHWINPREGKWTYTYHDRLFHYHLDASAAGGFVNQVEALIEKLCETPYSRRAQAITWIPFSDPGTQDPPCLQRIWCRIFEGEDAARLSFHAHWRSRDAYRAAFMNLFGITELQKSLAEEISRRTGRQVLPGQYVDISDSYHIYGDSIPDFQQRFLPMLEKRAFFDPQRSRSRTMRSDDPVAVDAFEHGRNLLRVEQETGRKGVSSS